MTIIDAWMQHPTARHANHEMFASLRRWNKQDAPTKPAEVPLDLTIAAMDAGGLSPKALAALSEQSAALLTDQ